MVYCVVVVSTKNNRYPTPLRKSAGMSTARILVNNNSPLNSSRRKCRKCIFNLTFASLIHLHFTCVREHRPHMGIVVECVVDKRRADKSIKFDTVHMEMDTLLNNVDTIVTNSILVGKPNLLYRVQMSFCSIADAKCLTCKWFCSVVVSN